MRKSRSVTLSYDRYFKRNSIQRQENYGPLRAVTPRVSPEPKGLHQLKSSTFLIKDSVLLPAASLYTYSAIEPADSAASS